MSVFPPIQAEDEDVRGVRFNVKGHPSCPTVTVAASGVPGQSLRQPLRDLSLTHTRRYTEYLSTPLLGTCAPITSFPVYLPTSNRDSTVNNSDKYVSSAWYIRNQLKFHIYPNSTLPGKQ